MIIYQVYGCVHRQKTHLVAAELTTSPGRGGGSLEIFFFLTFFFFWLAEEERHASGKPPPPSSHQSLTVPRHLLRRLPANE